ncbi:MAG TPA: hypothetical protein VFA09_10065 [Ktedonobacteraceae bacterium]|jgi:hypothetical protein|nr:hypothetical protein [Ktedonobacteraceae bacterium]
MQMQPLNELPPSELSYAEREAILWTAARRYMRGEITSKELKAIEDRYGWSIIPRLNKVLPPDQPDKNQA